MPRRIAKNLLACAAVTSLPFAAMLFLPAGRYFVRAPLFTHRAIVSPEEIVGETFVELEPGALVSIELRRGIVPPPRFRLGLEGTVKVDD